jgi:hypothetical protein
LVPRRLLQKDVATYIVCTPPQFYGAEMQTAEILANPFSLMMNPAEIFEALERSRPLDRLQRRVCRPLDKPLIARKGLDMNDYDSAIDAEAESDES